MKIYRINLKDGSYWELSIIKDEGRFCWKRIWGSKFRYSTTGKQIQDEGTNISSINPIPMWITRISWNLLYLRMKLKNELYKRCQGCGCGIAKYRIRDPNHGSGNKRFNCCKGCVNFYDMRWSAMDIISWKDKKPICEKGTRCIEIKGGRRTND